MATVLPLAQPDRLPDEFVEALNGLADGIVSLQFVRRTLASALSADDRLAPALRSLVDDAYQAGRLSAADHEVLSDDLGGQLGEDMPTECPEGIASGTPGDHLSPRLSPGAVLRNRFVLQSRLGASSMSEVFKALDLRRQETGAAGPWVAIKIVSPRTPQFSEALKLLQQEATLAQRLVHPNIVRIFDFDGDGDYAYITMEWLDGESLAELLTRQRYRPFTVARSRQILNAIGAALSFAHERDITHADVKPGNIYLTTSGQAKLLDFGAARSGTDTLTGQSAAARTVAYASCEVLEGAAPTAQDDVYSLACVAYRMLGGRRAFGHHDALAAERVGRAPSRIRHLSAGQWAALEQALAFRRKERTPDIGTFLRSFNAIAAAPATPAAATPAADVTPQSRRRIRRMWMSIAVCIVIAACGWLLLRARTGSAVPATRPAVAAPATRQGVPPPPAATRATKPAAGAPPVRENRTSQVSTKTSASGERRGANRSGAKAAGPPAPAPPPGNATRDATTAANKKSDAPAMADRPGSASTPGQAVVPDRARLASAAPPAPGSPETAQATVVATEQVRLTDLKFKRYVEPRAPQLDRVADPMGWVQLSFTVDTGGETRDIAIDEASPPGRYETAALTAIRRWRFEPVIENGRPVAKRTRVRLRFQ